MNTTTLQPKTIPTTVYDEDGFTAEEMAEIDATWEDVMSGRIKPIPWDMFLQRHPVFAEMWENRYAR
ncbi:MAG: hypothetical protein LBO69_08995 [Ignavibacteria bacterium]|jgi:hypothetical protein|nr:hypothetical protein [Ignavibacteria bacterium]